MFSANNRLLISQKMISKAYKSALLNLLRSVVWGMSPKTVFKWIGVMTTVLIFYITFIIICI